MPSAMTLDPQVQAILDQLAAAPGPSLADMPVADGRALYNAMSTLTEPKDVPVGKVDTTTISGLDGEIPVRIYAPVAAAGMGPGLIYYHGGGWVIGNLDTHDALCRLIALETGFKVISVDYRLAPEHPFPAAVDDAMAAARWVEENAADLDIDANRLVVAGDSAGGNLAAVVAQMARRGGPSIAYQALLYPVTEALADTASMAAFAEGYLLERKTMDWFVSQYVPAEADLKDPRISPLRAEDLSGLPPAYIVTADFDPLRDEGRAYAERLKEAGVAVTFVNYEGMVHGFMGMAGAIDTGRRAVADMGAALKAALS